MNFLGRIFLAIHYSFLPGHSHGFSDAANLLFKETDWKKVSRTDQLNEGSSGIEINLTELSQV